MRPTVVVLGDPGEPPPGIEEAEPFADLRSATSVEDLRSKLLAFIDYFNQVFAKPFKWTYTGRPLQV